MTPIVCKIIFNTAINKCEKFAITLCKWNSYFSLSTCKILAETACKSMRHMMNADRECKEMVQKLCGKIANILRDGCDFFSVWQ